VVEQVRPAGRTGVPLLGELVPVAGGTGTPAGETGHLSPQPWAGAIILCVMTGGAMGP